MPPQSSALMAVLRRRSRQGFPECSTTAGHSIVVVSDGVRSLVRRDCQWVGIHFQRAIDRNPVAWLRADLRKAGFDAEV